MTEDLVSAGDNKNNIVHDQSYWFLIRLLENTTASGFAGFDHFAFVVIALSARLIVRAQWKLAS